MHTIKPNLKKLTLSFKDPVEEEEFLEEYYVRNLNDILMSFKTGAVLYLLFALLDYFYYPHLFKDLIAIRIVVVFFVSLAGLTLYILKPTPRLIQTMTAVVVVMGGLGITIMLTLNDESITLKYFPGMMLVMMFNTSYARQRFIHAVAIQLVLFVMMYTAFFLKSGFTNSDVILLSFFILGATIIGVFTTYTLEFKARVNFLYRRKIAGQNLLLEKTIEEKSDLFRWVVHDLRTPLMVITTYNRILKRKTKGADQELDITLRSAQKIEGMVNNLLKTSALEEEKLENKKETFNLYDLLSIIISDHKVLAEKKEIQIFFKGVRESNCCIDAALFEDILSNLISNAIKYTYEGKSIFVSLEEREGEYYIEVKDQGVGVPDSDLDKLFKKFGTTGSKPTGGEDSSGLGLFIVKKIVTLMKGKVGYRRNEYMGSTFWVSFPANEKVCDV